MFVSYDPSVGWNGTYGGEIVPAGVYIWHIATDEITSDKKIDTKGHVTVLYQQVLGLSSSYFSKAKKINCFCQTIDDTFLVIKRATRRLFLRLKTERVKLRPYLP